MCEEVNEEDEDVSVTITNARIIGVIQLDKYRACLKCKARVEPLNPPLGRCSKSDCLMTQRCMIFVQRASGKLLFMHGPGAQLSTCTLYAFGQTLQELANSTSADEVTSETLLKCGSYSEITFNARIIITDVKETN